MTNIEMDVARSTIRMNKAVADHLQDIDWEQRRYEIAKDAFIMYGRLYPDATPNACAFDAVNAADALIEELKRTQTQK